ncbi:ribonuclease R family protein [Leptolyngbya iicbica]|uniref:exoribonuclease II n=2 Tax=Cyanophyceae TaxID=3028117 RepID=A0A4Q7E3N5_9CYAN|nr:ribonuclease R family protein [Leptolyngbya sp. LK]RZM76637.1 VacB/RNase II family 3'-5' exoribonuclease [Leptolyngbya sp. LK]
MNFSIASLLANFTDGKTHTLKNIQKKLHCDSDDSVRELQIALDALERIGVLAKEKGKYQRATEDGVVEGKLRCSSKGFCFAIQDDEAADDIYIRESQLNTAWNGDRVLVRVTKDGSRRRSPEGEVKVILERANASVLARVKQENESYQAVPLDDRLLFELSLDDEAEKLQQAVDQLAHIEVVRYPLAQEPPHGRIAQILGSDAEAASDIDIVYCKYDLPRTFPDNAFEEAKGLPTRVRKADLKGRLDLRDQLTVTIHSSQAQVIDDALTIAKTEDGNWQLGVHIADVAHYVPLHSPIDREALKRGMAVYLGNEMIPLVPPPLATSLCSLNPGKDRLAISLLATLNAEGEVLEFELQPSVIAVDHALDYKQAQAILSRENPEELEKLEIESKDLKKLEPIFEVVDHLYEVSRAVRQQRMARGSFELNLPEHEFPDDAKEPLASYASRRFQYDDEGLLGVIVVASSLTARMVVTEFILLANQLVASHLKALAVPAIYRLHRTPTISDVQELTKLAENMDINLELAEEETIYPMDYQRFTQQFAASPSEKILTYLLLSTFKPAFYGIHPDLHFGLALTDGYAHFSSPTRRYPDLVIHRVLHAIFSDGRDRRSTRSKDRVNLRHSSCHGKINWNVLPPDINNELEDYIKRIVGPLSEREQLAQDAETDLEGLKKAEFMRDHTGSVFHGLITGVQSYGFFVEIEELLVEGLVHVSSLKDDWYEYRSRQQKLVGRKNRRQFRLGDRVEVQVKSVDYYRQQIDLVVVGGGSEASEDDLNDDDMNDDRGHDESE